MSASPNSIKDVWASWPFHGGAKVRPLRVTLLLRSSVRFFASLRMCGGMCRPSMDLSLWQYRRYSSAVSPSSGLTLSGDTNSPPFGGSCLSIPAPNFLSGGRCLNASAASLWTIQRFDYPDSPAFGASVEHPECDRELVAFVLDTDLIKFLATGLSASILLGASGVCVEQRERHIHIVGELAFERTCGDIPVFIVVWRPHCAHELHTLKVLGQRPAALRCCLRGPGGLYSVFSVSDFPSSIRASKLSAAPSMMMRLHGEFSSRRA